MLRTGGRLTRGLLCTGFATAALAVVGVASASAAITHTSITSPTNPFVYRFDGNASPTPTVTVQGTSDGSSTTSDAVDINCYYTTVFGGVDYESLASNVAVDSNGAFSQDVTFDLGLVVPGLNCRLRAVPYNNDYPNNYNAYQGPDVVNDSTFQQPVSGSGPPFEGFVYTGVETSGSSNAYGSAGECGVFSWPMYGRDSYDAVPTWDCGASLYKGDGTGQRSEIQIDGTNAYDSGSAADAGFSGDNTQAGFPPVTSSWARDSSGNVSMSDSENLVSCPNGAYPASSSNCSTWESDGVSLSRTTSQTDSGQLVQISDTFTSTDGVAHSLNLEYDNGFDAQAPVWQLPGTSSQAYSGGDSSTLPSNSEAAIYASDGELASGGAYDGPGAIVYTTAPNLASFVNGNEMLLNYQRTIPAGGSVTITQYFVTSEYLSSTQKIVNGLLSQSNKPKVSITSPAPNTVTSASSVQVSGTASANDNLSLKVNGAAVPVNSDGTWSTSVSLQNGADTITAVASDGSGNTAQASETVYYNLEGAFCIVPKVSHMKLAKAKKALKAAGCKVGKVHKVKSKVKKGHVLHASYSAHVVLSHGTKVGLTVSSGKPKKGHHKHSVRMYWHLVPGDLRRG